MIPSFTDIAKEAAGDDALAHDWLMQFAAHAHSVDDLIDNDAGGREYIVKLFANTNLLYTHPFYAQHAARLQMAVMLALNAYADSLEWENSEEMWRKRWADVLRFAGNDIVVAVAAITGGFDRMRAVSLKLRERSWIDHHDERGEI